MEKLEITKEFDLEVKRFYLPIQIERNCPKCGTKCEHDLSQDYLSYPTVNKKESIYFYCNECEHEFEIDVKLKISLEADKETRDA